MAVHYKMSMNGLRAKSDVKRCLLSAFPKSACESISDI